jgi:hypothetical protein
VVTIGKTGEWVGPLVVGLLAGLLDYSAAGPVALRDRVAVMGYYACTVSMSAVLGWTGYIRGEVQDYNWLMIGALISLVAHGALLVVFLGRPKTLAKALSKPLRWNSADSNAVKINQTLLGWTVTAGLAAPLSGTQGFGHLVDGIAGVTTGAWSSIVTAVLHWLGG